MRARQECARAFGLARLCSAQTLALCGGDEVCLPDAEGRASREAVDLALLALNNSVLITIPAERLDVDGYATLETLLPTYFRGLRQAAPPRPPFQRKDRSQGAAARALRRLCDADQQIFDAAALIYQRRAKECEAAARCEHAVELRHRLALNRQRERRAGGRPAPAHSGRRGGRRPAAAPSPAVRGADDGPS